MSREDTFDTALKEIFRNFMAGVSTAIPAVVTEFDGKNRISAQPVIKIRPVGGDEQNLPVVSDIPVIFPGGSQFKITWPISEGDGVLLVAAQRDISNFKDAGGVQSAASLRRFDMSDAVAIVGLDSFSAAPSVGTSLKIEGASGAVVELDDAGNVSINGVADNAAGFADLKTGFDLLRTQVNAFITIFNAHVHSGVLTGPAVSGVTATPGIPVSATIDAAKIESVKLP